MQSVLLPHSGRKKAGPKELARWKADLVLPKFGFHYVRAAHSHEQPSLCYIIATRYDFCQKYDCKQACPNQNSEKNHHFLLGLNQRNPLILRNVINLRKRTIPNVFTPIHGIKTFGIVPGISLTI